MDLKYFAQRIMRLSVSGRVEIEVGTLADGTWVRGENDRPIKGLPELPIHNGYIIVRIDFDRLVDYCPGSGDELSYTDRPLRASYRAVPDDGAELHTVPSLTAQKILFDLFADDITNAFIDTEFGGTGR